MKKKILIFFNIVFIICFLIKLYHSIILINIHKNLNDFQNQTNRSYVVRICDNSEKNNIQQIYLKENISLYNLSCNNVILYSEWQDRINGKKFNFKNNDKELLTTEYEILEKNESLYDLPNLFRNNDHFKYLFQIYYIIPTTYNDTKAFKIVTASEEIIIDANTFLPVHLIKKNYNSNNNLENCIEYNYEFEIGTVTDEDVALPNLSEYKLID